MANQRCSFFPFTFAERRGLGQCFLLWGSDRKSSSGGQWQPRRLNKQRIGKNSSLSRRHTRRGDINSKEIDFPRDIWVQQRNISTRKTFAGYFLLVCVFSALLKYCVCTASRPRVIRSLSQHFRKRSAASHPRQSIACNCSLMSFTEWVDARDATHKHQNMNLHNTLTGDITTNDRKKTKQNKSV